MNVDMVVEGMQAYGRPVEFSEDRTKARFVADIFMNAHDQYSGPIRLTFQGMTAEQMAQMSQGYWLEPSRIAVNDSMFQYDMSGNPVSSPSMGHSVTVADSDGGTLTVDKEEAEEGELVTIGAVPEDGWLLSGLYVNDGEVGVALNADGTFSFAMPNKDVTVMAEWEDALPPAPIITTQPVSCKQVVGKKVKFVVVAEGEGLTYQWQYRKPGSTKWLDSSFSSANSATLTFAMSELRSTRTYHCVVTDAYGRFVESDEVEAILVEGPTIVTQPASVRAAIGNAVKITVEATGNGLAYRWQYLNPGKTKWADSTLSIANAATLKFKMSSKYDGKKYRCVVTDGDGISVTSDAADVTLVPGPIITAQPEGVTAVAGEKVSFSIKATGEELTYQWQYQDVGKTKWANSSLAGNKTDTLRITATAARDGRKLRCVVTDKDGIVVVSESAELTVR